MSASPTTTNTRVSSLDEIDGARAAARAGRGGRPPSRHHSGARTARATDSETRFTGRASGYERPISDQERPLFLVVTIKPRLDRLEEAEAQLQSMRRNSLTEPGCVFMHLVQPQDDPDTWVMLEMFRSRAAWDEHMRQPYNTEGNIILEDLLREPSDLRLFDEK
jgi:quinol monooxygenase YgiN